MNKGPIIFGLVMSVVVTCVVVPTMWFMYHETSQLQRPEQPKVEPPAILVAENTEIEYIKDTRTNLCFAVLNSTVVGYGMIDDVKSFTHVPCETIKQNKK